jgi:hypothetical protein
MPDCQEVRAELRAVRNDLRIAKAEYADAVATITELRERVALLEREVEEPRELPDGCPA